MDTIIDIQFKENEEVLNFLESQHEISFRNDVDNKLKKVLLLSVASFFEKEVTDLVMNYISNKTEDNHLIVSFVNNKAISRQYHTYFDWKGKNANQFFGLFGSDFKKEIEKEIKEKELETAVKAFLELGGLRNNMVHQNTGIYNIEKTTKEIYELYKIALSFLSFLNEKFS
ncbi:HEPN domain-containing protein [Halalkalibacter kiskunsagensis]|uniref:HEPN domain-containing protein n=1 Tax=Halalkalibacter kiskunsagensis TaxID=1548599 RepID=A0ABV6KJ78_9BACI